MITLIGTGVYKGVSIAEAVVVGKGGLADVPTELIMRGISSIRRGDLDTDMPSVIVISGTVDDAFSLEIPGIKVSGVAAESTEGYADVCHAPCVVGLEGLLRAVTNGDIVIVDGGKGIVYVDPEADILTHYQLQEEDRQKTPRLLLESVHLPAMTQEGKVISVYAVLGGTDEVPTALEEGADGLLIPEPVAAGLTDQEWTRILDDACGKPLFVFSTPDDEGLRALTAFSLPYQVTIVLPFNRVSEVEKIHNRILEIAYELATRDVKSSEIELAVLIDSQEQAEALAGSVRLSRVVIDVAHCDDSSSQTAMASCISSAALWTEDAADDDAETTRSTIILESSLDAVRYLPIDGVDSVAVPLGLTTATKDLIRSFPSSE